MTYKKFQDGDIVYSTIVTKPDCNFTIHNKNVYLNYEISEDGTFSNGMYSNKIKHIQQGELSLYEMNINRPFTTPDLGAPELVYQFIEKDTTRYASRTISAQSYDDHSQFGYGDKVAEAFPLTASISRIFVDEGQEFDINSFDTSRTDITSFSKSNKKYIRALKNVIAGQDSLLVSGAFKYNDLGTKKVNMICIPAIFYGSTIAKESIELNVYVTGTLAARARDVNGNGVLLETYGQNVNAPAGIVLYDQGIMLLTGSWSHDTTYTDQFFAGGGISPSWITFGTGIKTVGTPILTGSVANSAYEVKFKGTNKIPTVTMKTYAEKNEMNFSHNPTFLDFNQIGPTSTGTEEDPYFAEGESKIKNIKDSKFTGHDSEFENTTYISKIGVYDKNKNLIAVATLANPVKKTEFRDYMFKLRMDF